MQYNEPGCLYAANDFIAIRLCDYSYNDNIWLCFDLIRKVIKYMR